MSSRLCKRSVLLLVIPLLAMAPLIKLWRYDMHVNVLINSYTTRAVSTGFVPHDLGVVLGEIKDQTFDVIECVYLVMFAWAVVAVYAVKHLQNTKGDRQC